MCWRQKRNFIIGDILGSPSSHPHRRDTLEILSGPLRRNNPKRRHKKCWNPRCLFIYSMTDVLRGSLPKHPDSAHLIFTDAICVGRYFSKECPHWVFRGRESTSRAANFYEVAHSPERRKGMGFKTQGGKNPRQRKTTSLNPYRKLCYNLRGLSERESFF